jgi:hypothetical protein
MKANGGAGGRLILRRESRLAKTLGGPAGRDAAPRLRPVVLLPRSPPHLLDRSGRARLSRRVERPHSRPRQTGRARALRPFQAHSRSAHCGCADGPTSWRSPLDFGRQLRRPTASFTCMSLRRVYPRCGRRRSRPAGEGTWGAFTPIGAAREVEAPWHATLGNEREILVASSFLTPELRRRTGDMARGRCGRTSPFSASGRGQQQLHCQQ